MPDAISIPPKPFSFHFIDEESNQPLIGPPPVRLEKINCLLALAGDEPVAGTSSDSAGTWTLELPSKHKLIFGPEALLPVIEDSVIFDRVYQVCQMRLQQKFAQYRESLK